MLAFPSLQEVAHMDRVAAASVRLERADDLPAILEAAFDAFDDMLPVIEAQQDPAGGAFTTFVMSAAFAANGRDAVLFAPSLPPSASRGPIADRPGCGGALEAAIALAGLGRLLDLRLTDASAQAVSPGDRRACIEGARQARRLVSLLAGAAGQ